MRGVFECEENLGAVDKNDMASFYCIMLCLLLLLHFAVIRYCRSFNLIEAIISKLYIDSHIIKYIMNISNSFFNCGSKSAN